MVASAESSPDPRGHLACSETDQRVAVALSGGVDSAVAAHLLQAQGCDVFGLTFDNNTAASAEAVSGARRIAAELSIPLQIVEVTETFESAVLQPCWQAYARGCTPNPCVICNPVLKFGVLLDCARHHGADRLATGHHVRIRHDAVKGRRRLKRGVEREKDQSYFLYALSQQQLAHVCFPVGGLTKREVRAIARTRGLSCAERKESQDVCFAVSGTPFPELLRRRFGGPARPGAIVDTKGKVLGRHRGVHRYTIGQRKGLGVAASKRLYVVALDSDHAEVVLGGEKELYCRVLKVEDVRWAPGFLLTETFRATVKIRYRHPGAPAVLTPLTDGAVEVVFDTPQRAITDGQAAVFYCGDTVVGGGVISQKNQ